MKQCFWAGSGCKLFDTELTWLSCASQLFVKVCAIKLANSSGSRVQTEGKKDVKLVSNLEREHIKKRRVNSAVSPSLVYLGKQERSHSLKLVLVQVGCSSDPAFDFAQIGVRYEQ